MCVFECPALNSAAARARTAAALPARLFHGAAALRSASRIGGVQRAAHGVAAARAAQGAAVNDRAGLLTARLSAAHALRRAILACELLALGAAHLRLAYAALAHAADAAARVAGAAIRIIAPRAVLTNRKHVVINAPTLAANVAADHTLVVIAFTPAAKMANANFGVFHARTLAA